MGNIRIDLPPIFSVLATVRKGDEKQGGKIGRDTGAFRFAASDALAPELQSEIERVLAGLYGERPKSIGGLRVLGTTLDDCMYSSWRVWNQSKSVVACDGETISKRFHNGQVMRGEHCRKGANKECPLGCKLEGALTLFCPELSNAIGVMGTLRFVTTSDIDVHHWLGILQGAQRIAPLSAFQFTMHRNETQRIDFESGGKTHTRDNHPVRIMYRLLPNSDPALPAPVDTIPALPSGDDEPELFNGANADHKALMGQWLEGATPDEKTFIATRLSDGYHDKLNAQWLNGRDLDELAAQIHDARAEYAQPSAPDDVDEIPF